VTEDVWGAAEVDPTCVGSLASGAGGVVLRVVARASSLFVALCALVEKENSKRRGMCME